jgi:thiosulfate/3-mercaptopyruvate sulfurtransferase
VTPAGRGPAGGAGDVLVSPDWLAAHLGDGDLRIVDVRGQVRPPGAKPRYFAKRSDYDAAHVPGAVFLDWTRDIIDPDDPVPMQIARPEAFAAKMSELGIGDDTCVVAYDDYDHIFAGRFAWALRYYGHDAVRLLDGGWVRWHAENRPTAADTPELKPARFTPRPRPGLRRTADEVMAALDRTDVLLVDARAPEQYAGRVTAAGRGGHIPGARNVHYARLVDPGTGAFLAADELRHVFAQAGVDVGNLPREVVVYCNGGVSCTVPLHALRILGRDDVAVYDGSWNEWGVDESRPVRTGLEP